MSTTSEQGITSLLAPVMVDMDKAIAATQQSQEELGKEIERLVAGNITMSDDARLCAITFLFVRA